MDNENKEQVNNQDFLDALRGMIMSDEPQNRIKAFEEFKKADFIAPIKDQTVEEDGQPKQIQFQLLKDDQGHMAFPVFTDEEEMSRMSEEKQNFVKVNAMLYAQMFAQNPAIEVGGVVVNPFGMSLSLAKQFFVDNYPQVFKNVGGVPKGVKQKQLPPNTKITFRLPENPRTEMLAAVSEYFKLHKEVKKAFFLEAFVGEKTPENLNLMMVLDVEGEVKKSLLDGVGKIAAPFHEGIQLGLADYNTDFGKSAAKPLVPFYTVEA